MALASTKKPDNRLRWVDQTKGAAILAIALFHFFQNYPRPSSVIADFARNGAKLGYAGVDIFFVMAGFTITYVMASRLGNINWKLWLKKRLARLYPTYFLAVICGLLLSVVLRGRSIQLNLDFILSVLGLAGYHFQAINPGFWFFTVILEAYLITPLLFRLCQKRPELFLLFGIVFGILTKLICFVLAPGSPLYLFCLQTNFLGSYIFQFCLGLYWGLIYFEYQRFRKIDWLVSLAVFGAGLLTYAAMSLKGIEIVYMMGFDIVFTPFMFIGLGLGLDALCHKQFAKSGLALAAIAGIYSYQIYLIHQPLMFTTLPYLVKYIALADVFKVPLIFVTIIGLLSIYVWGFIALESFLRKKFSDITSYSREQGLKSGG
jgi:peptidoglycan/LPS O-acetylase OafA/YrhL